MKNFGKVINFVASAGISLATILFMGVALVNADSNYFPLAPGVPLTQNWSNTALIAASDNWSAVPSILGYRGDDAAVVTVVSDVQTVVTDYSAIVDVNEGITLPNTFVTAGVTEFEIADPVVALSANGASDFPNLELRLDTTSCVSPNSVMVQYNLRDIDGSADNAIQQVALQYRIGASGDFTNVPAGYVADATTGPSLASLVTPVAVALPGATLGQSQLHVRMITANASGNDEWVGIDDINISCLAPTAARVSIGGRVFDGYGHPISRAVIQVIGGDLLTPKQAVTNSFGYYSVQDLLVGEVYFVSARAKGQIFNPPSVPVNLFDKIGDLDFVAEP